MVIHSFIGSYHNNVYVIKYKFYVEVQFWNCVKHEDTFFHVVEEDKTPDTYTI